MSTTRVLIFAKAPLAGYAKTRLIPALGAAGAADLAQRMLSHTLDQALAAGIGPVELCLAPDADDAAWRDISLPLGVEISSQGPGDLGARMSRASERALSKDGAALLIGTDCVEMSAELLQDAEQILHFHQSVIHCTLDGGYALLGIKQFSPLLFNEVPWSTNAVASNTLSRIGRLGWSVHIGRMLHDVDEPQDLKYLPEQWCNHAEV